MSSYRPRALPGFFPEAVTFCPERFPPFVIDTERPYLGLLVGNNVRRDHWLLRLISEWGVPPTVVFDVHLAALSKIGPYRTRLNQMDRTDFIDLGIYLVRVW